VKIPAQLSKAGQPNAEPVMACSHKREPSLFDDFVNRTDRRGNQRLEDGIDKRSNGFAPSSRPNRDKWPLPLMRLDQDEDATWQQVVSGSLEGMDHARKLDSSKGPAEERHLEWVAAEANLLC
jgi:hypothetical protein